MTPSLNTSAASARNQASPAGRLTGSAPSGYNLTKISNYTPEQTDLMQSLFSHVSPGSYTSRLASGDPEIFKQIEAPALRQFQELQGQLGSRFSGMGSGARNSSGFKLASNAATSNFAQDLQSRRHDLQHQAIQELMGMSQQLLSNRPFENVLTPQRKSPVQVFFAFQLFCYFFFSRRV